MTKIVICIDGTGNEIGDRESNVLKLYKAMRKDDQQLAQYVMGVGTFDGTQYMGRARQAVNALLGQAFGYGLEDDVLTAYRFLCRNYRSKDRKQKEDTGLSDAAAESDHIYLCGFSRGAYAARILAGFVHNFGLVAPDKLHLIVPVFRAYRRVTDADPSDKDAKVFKALREYEAVLSPEPAAIRALLLFDTVSSLIRFRRPFYNLRKHASFAEFGTHASVNSNVSVRIVLHALAWHERRSLFRPQLWNPKPEDRSEKAPDGEPLYYGNNFRVPARERIQQVRQRWFSGFHSDVGGSPPEDQSGLGKISLLWMLDALSDAEKAADAQDNAARKKARKGPLPGRRQYGLKLKTGARKSYLEGQDPDKKTPGGLPYVGPDAEAPLHDSHKHGALAWLWVVLEFFPKSLRRRETGPVKWYRRGWLIAWYLPLFEPRQAHPEQEVDPSLRTRLSQDRDHQTPR
ncbi:DUF2235 domain-containing protein [Lentibacter algarum]|uniref:T6SS phospholipase effector Tle1-like catalytic domain-containing protein n=1 Tax=Lentibacter algarum TaxID=576131 RepID=UPI001C065D3E|nr:DUF2235 domain-containing protein [Lentibacter algarum]MBU2981867.1 DUF2235 domain-containing protein [Lentibacter algarum]